MTVKTLGNLPHSLLCMCQNQNSNQSSALKIMLPLWKYVNEGEILFFNPLNTKARRIVYI